MEKIARLDLPKVARDTTLRSKLDFILPGLLRGSVALLVGPGGVSKSFLALQTAVVLALGKDHWKLWPSKGWMPKPEGRRVVILNLEDTPDIIAVRMHDVFQSLFAVAGVNIPGNKDERDLIYEVNSRVDIMPLYGQGVSIGQMNNESRQIEPTAWLRRIEAYLEGDNETQKADLVILDTFNRSLGGLDENSSGQMGPVLGLLEGVCKRIGCSFLIIHHVNKLSMVTGDGGAQQAIRGASAITDNCRWQTNLSTMSKEEGKKRGFDIDKGTHKTWVQVDLSKINYGEPQPSRWLQRGKFGVLDGREDPPEELATSNFKKSKGAKNFGSSIGPSSDQGVEYV